MNQKKRNTKITKTERQAKWLRRYMNKPLTAKELKIIDQTYQESFKKLKKYKEPK